MDNQAIIVVEGEMADGRSADYRRLCQLISVVTVIEIGTETAVFQQN